MVYDYFAGVYFFDRGRGRRPVVRVIWTVDSGVAGGRTLRVDRGFGGPRLNRSVFEDRNTIETMITLKSLGVTKGDILPGRSVLMFLLVGSVSVPHREHSIPRPP